MTILIMKEKQVNRTGIVFLIILIFLCSITACTPKQTTTPTPTPTVTSKPTPLPVATPTQIPTPFPTSCKEIEGTCLELTFDGENCTYDGPVELTSGPVKLIFNNKSDGKTAVNFSKIYGGRTIEDVIEYFGEEPSIKHAPLWSRDIVWRILIPGSRHYWEVELEPSNYFIVCVRIEPIGVWLGAGLTVED